MNRTGKWAKRAVWLTLLGVMAIGCSPLQTAAFLFHRDQKEPAQYPLRPETGEKKEKDKELVVLILTQFSPGQQYDLFAVGADRELAAKMAKDLTDYAKADKQKLTVVTPAKLDAFKAQHPNWKAMRPAEIGKKLGADVVLDVAVGPVNVYQPGSRNEVYEGRASVDVGVYDTADPTGAAKWTYPYPFVFPKTKLTAVEQLPLPQFRMDFVNNLAVELVRKHIEHRPSEGIAGGN
jgi:hypothetical protein